MANKLWDKGYSEDARIDAFTVGNDRELDGLAVAAILSYSPENIKKLSDAKKQALTENFISLFNSINMLAEKYEVPIIYSCHPRSKKRLDDMREKGLFFFKLSEIV